MAQTDETKDDDDGDDNKDDDDDDVAITGRLWPLSAWAQTINKEGGRPAMAQGFENFTLKMNLRILR